MPSRYSRILLCVLLAAILLGSPRGTSRAQEGDPSPLQYNVPALVNLPAGQVVLRTFNVTAGDSFELRLNRLADFACTVVVLDPRQQAIPLVPGPEGDYVFEEPGAAQSGAYAIIMQAGGAGGEMLIQVTSSSAGLIPLAVGETRVTVGSAPLRYSLTVPTDAPGGMTLLLSAVEGGPEARLPELSLEGIETGVVALAVSAGMLPGVSVTLPAGAAYVLALQPGAGPVQVRLTWTAVSTAGLAETASASATPLPASTLAGPITTGPCQVSFSGPVNIRNGPSTAHVIIGGGNPGMVLNVTGRNGDTSWWQVVYNAQNGWVSNQITAVATQGDCAAIPQASFPAAPTATPSPTSTPTLAWTATPTATATPTVTSTPIVVATLNFSLPPVYGSSALTSGFVPDPFTVGVTGGGPANVAYLGGGCSGFATSAPSFSVNYTAGAFPLLRFYYIGNADSTMVINTPGGSYVCVDDSFGTLNPTIDFNSPASGRYDVWIGSFAQGATVGGTLYVTENSGNHP